MSLPPGPRAPELYQTFWWLRRPTELLETCAARYGASFSLSIIGMGKIVVLADPESLRTLFSAGPFEVCQPRNARFLAALGPSSLLLLNGAEHLRHRRLIVPALRGRYSRHFSEALQKLRGGLLDSWPVGRPLALLPLLQELTRSIMVRVLLGFDDDAADEAGAASAALGELCARAIPIVEAPGMVLPLSLQALLGRRSPWRRALAILEEGDRLLYKIIAARRRARDLAEREDILSQLILARDEASRPLADRELRDELFTLLVASHDTTAITVCWTLHELLRAPAILAALRKEVLEAPESLDRAPLLEAVLRESQRLWPVFPILGRQLLIPMRLGGYDLPAGTRVALCPYLSQRSPLAFADPQRFDPQRFDPRQVARGRGALPGYYPFGGGLRHCAGAELAMYEMKQLLSALLLRFELAPVQVQGKVAPVTPGWRFFSLAPRGGLEVIIRAKNALPKALERDSMLDETPSFLPILRAL